MKRVRSSRKNLNKQNSTTKSKSVQKPKTATASKKRKVNVSVRPKSATSSPKYMVANTLVSKTNWNTYKKQMEINSWKVFSRKINNLIQYRQNKNGVTFPPVTRPKQFKDNTVLYM